jgi:two-component system, LytTR family, sensor kinase
MIVRPDGARMLAAQPVLYRFAAIVAAWTVVGLFTAAQTQLQLNARGEVRAPWSVLGPALIGAWIWALYTPPLVMLARRLRRLREHRAPSWRRWALYSGAHFCVAAVGTVADAAVWARVRPLIDGIARPFDVVFAATLLMNVASYLAVVTLTEAVDYAARWREREDAAAALARTADALRQKLNDARLRALEAQLRPHFLYNTLNLVAELVHDEPDAADEMLTHLGALLRRSYLESPQLVPLREEVFFVRAYGEILARRYGDRVSLTIAVPPELEAHPVPAFTLQPLVENAFRHGVERRERGSSVEVTAVSEGGSLVVRVRDRGFARGRELAGGGPPAAGLQPHAAALAGDGIGLGNTRERLELLYGSAAGLTLTRLSSETVASVWLPLDASAVARDERADGAGPAARAAADAAALG